MNRREFTASLGATLGASALPLPAIGAATGAPAVVSNSVYKWAQLIARAQSGVSPTMLARHLNIPPQAAQTVFKTLLRDGLVKTGGMLGTLQATRPAAPSPQVAAKQVQAAWTNLHQSDADTEALVIADDPALECGQTCKKDRANASPDQSIQESPQSG